MQFRRVLLERRPLLALTLSLLLIHNLTALPLSAQDEEEEPPPPLNIVVVEGEGAMNSIRNYQPHDVAVRVEDSHGNPVPRASVTFQLPEAGPGGTFYDGKTVAMVMTDQNGEARITGFKPNGVQGEFQIRVTAAAEGKTANVAMTQTNVMAVGGTERGSKTALWILIGGAAAGIGAAMALAGGKDNGGGGSGAVTITPGATTVGAPR